MWILGAGSRVWPDLVRTTDLTMTPRNPLGVSHAHEPEAVHV